MNDFETNRFLIKFRDGQAPSLRISARLGMNGPALTFAVKPLFRSIGAAGARGVAASGGAWQIAEASAQLDPGEAWDHCHDILAANPNAVAVEPDLVQQWPVAAPTDSGQKFGAAAGGPHPQDIGNGYAGVADDNYWFRNNSHNQMDSAFAQTNGGAGVRIAHLDTGYDPNHKSLPKNLRQNLAKNFVDSDYPNDATDKSDGLFNNFSHGCGTLSILAGATVPGLRPFGCAPNADIVPVRVANRVVLFSNSSIAQGLDYVHSLRNSDDTRVHVVSMSMGGLPSRSWADAINALYEAGVVVVTAAGNNYGNLPTHVVVYPARFGRVIAACGVMADGVPYANLPVKRMAGNYGPDAKMGTAIAAYTPNVPWARFGEPTVVDFTGNGTSSATPQVAAAAALWIEKHRSDLNNYREDWMRVEAVRKALFESAAKGAAAFAPELGNGMLRAADALSRPAAPASQLTQTPADGADFAFLKLLLGDSGPAFAAVGPSKAAMLDLEATQVAAKAGLDGREASMSRADIVEAMLARDDISKPLRAALTNTGVVAAPARKSSTPRPPMTPAASAMNQHFIKLALKPPILPPAFRRLRIYAYDPGQETDPTMFDVSVATVAVPWEDELKPGPVGEYIEVVDIDPASNACYAPVNLNDPIILHESGLAPSESSPQFHQQMAYAVSMRTIQRFELALGRKALWAHRRWTKNGGPLPNNGYVQRLRIYPHALREANAYYDPEKIALLFGYFPAADSSGSVVSGSVIFGAVAHDIVAHETTHALLDGLHPRYSERTNLDMAAFHEAFADIVALFQHFSMPESLTRQIRKAQGSATDIGRRLGQLAQQFGQAMGMHGALRRFVGEVGSAVPKLDDRVDEPHTRGAILVSAVFASFLTIYQSRSADLIRLATNGSGILPGGDISVDLANRLASEASKTAEHVLNMCIRALDYCPPVNLEFGDYLRAIITADRDLVRDDSRGYRVAFIDAFRERGIVPYDIKRLAEDSLLWEPPPMDPDLANEFSTVLPLLDLRWGMAIDRAAAFDLSRKNAGLLKNWLVDPNEPKRPLLRQILGFEEPDKQWTGVFGGQQYSGEIHPIEVHSVRVCRRTGPDGLPKSTLVIEITQTILANPDAAHYRGGCTLLFDLDKSRLDYVIRKRLLSPWSFKTQGEVQVAAMKAAADEGLIYYPPDDPLGRSKTFAMMHRHGRQA